MKRKEKKNIGWKNKFSPFLKGETRDFTFVILSVTKNLGEERVYVVQPKT
jgi:hypothetical protein